MTSSSKLDSSQCTTLPPEMLVLEDCGFHARRWQWLGNRWAKVHYAVGLSAITCGVLASTLAHVYPSAATAAGALAAIFSACVTFLKPEQEASKYRNAAAELFAEIAACKGLKGHPLDKVIGAYQLGLRLIAGGGHAASPARLGVHTGAHSAPSPTATGE